MPYSPFTRLFGTVIAVLAALALLWPDDQAQVWAFHSLAAAPILIAIFTWSAVRSAAPFDDEAFHRTLPPGDGAAFRRVIAIHGALLATLALCVCGYGLYRNFGWATISYGIVMVTVPAIVMMAVIGIVATFGSSRGPWRTFAILALVATPLFSIALRAWAREGFGPENPETWIHGEFIRSQKNFYYFPALRTTILAATLLYPLIWWLIAVGRRRVLGLFFAGWTGALLPWLYVYGDFMKRDVPEPEPEACFGGKPAAANTSSSLRFSRKPLSGERDRFIAMDDLVAIEGLDEGEFFTIGSMWLTMGDPGNPFSSFAIGTYEIDRNGNPTNRMRAMLAGRAGKGKTVWGQQAMWDHLRSRIPVHETFGPLPGSPEPETRLAIKPDAMGPHHYDPELVKQGQNDPLRQPWGMTIEPGVRWQDCGSFELRKGGRTRMSGGGVAEVEPLREQGEICHIVVKRYRDGLGYGDGPWFRPRRGEFGDFNTPQFLVLDESGKHASAPGQLQHNEEQLFLGFREEWSLRVPFKEGPEMQDQIEALRRSRLYVFFPRPSGMPVQVDIPPP